MIKMVLLISIVLVFTFSGCTSKVVERKVYIREVPYTFSKIDVDGMYIDAGSKELQQKCTPLVQESTGILKRIITDFYDWQIDNYNNIKGKNNDNTTKK